MTVVYILLATLGYAKLGTDFDFSAPVTSVLPRDAWVVIMNLALFFRCVVVRACIGTSFWGCRECGVVHGRQGEAVIGARDDIVRLVEGAPQPSRPCLTLIPSAHAMRRPTF